MHMRQIFTPFLLIFLISCDDGVKVEGACGDGFVDPAEQCDGAALNGADCTSVGFYFAPGLACRADCTFDTTGCTGRCGDGVLDDTEQCEGNNIGDRTCLTLGFSGGTLACDAENCTIDTSGCSGECGNGQVEGDEACDDGARVAGDGCSPGCLIETGWHCNGIPSYCEPTCGDGLVVGDEACDGVEVGDDTCETLGFYSGTITCEADCSALDTSACSGRCGDGLVDDGFGEACDGADLAGATCQDLGLTGDGLACDSSCSLDPTNCVGWVSVSAGGEHTCAIDTLGRLWCWGGNNAKQLGGDLPESTVGHPVQVTALPGTVLKVVVGGNHTCALLSSGSLWCWGGNGSGQCGIGEGTNPVVVPTQVQGMSSGVTDVSTGIGTTCALQNSALYCWGSSTYGQIGNGTSTWSFAPVLVADAVDPTRYIYNGGGHTCAIKEDDRVQCWGMAHWGQLGFEQELDQLTPALTPAFGTLSDMALGNVFTCARKIDDTLWCSGLGNRGQLGVGNTNQVNTPVQALVGNTVQGLTAGYEFTCIIKNDQSAWCWGANEQGQLGAGTGGTEGAQSNVPAQVGVLGVRALHIDAGAYHACAVRDDHTLWCWGSNELEQLGNGSAGLMSLVPVMVGGM